MLTIISMWVMKSRHCIGFKGGNVRYFTDLMKSPNWKTYYLKNNYRCGEKIIDMANEVICQADDIISMEAVCKSGEMGEVLVDSKYKIDNYLNSIKKQGNLKDWFILVRTNKDITKIEQKLNMYDIPYVSFKKGDLTLQEMRSKLSEDSIKLLTIHASKGLESKNVLMWGNFPIREKPYLRNNDELKVRYVGITRAIDECIILN